MNIFKFSIKLILLFLFVTIFFSTLQAKKLDKYIDGKDISNYFSGILLLQDNKYEESYNFLKKLDGLEENHFNYSSRYLFSLINLGKFNEAFNYSKKLEKKGFSNFESELIMGVYYLEDQKYDLAQKYFLKLKERNSKLILNNFISNSLFNWTSFNKLNFTKAQNIINEIDSNFFDNLKKIQNAFLHCYYKSEKTDNFFVNLISDQKIDFSRYNYFYASYLFRLGKIEESNKVINKALKNHPTNLLLNQFKHDLKLQKFKNNFDCQNLSNIIAEILYIAANALSSQNIQIHSNFYLNLSKYLNKKFYSFDTLLAENYYKAGNSNYAKKIYKELEKKGDAFFWYSSKQLANILLENKDNDQAINIVKNAYNKLEHKGIYEKFDYAEFLKNNDKFNEAIIFYTEIIKSININHPLYPEVTDGRGVCFERVGDWDKAEKDLLSSLAASPEQAYVINYLAYSWIEKGIKISKSLEMLKKANDLKSNDPFIIDSLGWALFKLEKYKESEKYLQSAVKLMPDDPIVNDHYGDVLWKVGEKIQARYYWNYVIKLDSTEKDLKEKIKVKLLLGI